MRLTVLRGRADEDLVDVHVRGLRDGVEHGPRDVVGLEPALGRVVEERRLDPAGEISVVRMPVPLRSARTASAIAVTAHFVLEYRLPGSTRRPATEPVSSTCPRVALSAGIAARTV